MSFPKNSKIYVAGHLGLVGSSICRKLEKEGYSNVITKTHKDLDLENYEETRNFIYDQKPQVIFIAAAKVGGIQANKNYPVDFLMSNLAIEANIIKSANEASVKRLIFLGSSCIYPRNAPQPIKEESLLSSKLESTNRAYALAKIAGIEMCWAYNRQYGTRYLAVMPSNLYGQNDNYDLENSHVLPALIRKIHEAKYTNKDNVTLWGSGSPKREFLYVDDLADALVFLMNMDKNHYNKLVDPIKCPLINVGSGSDISIANLANEIKKIIDYEGFFVYDKSRPDGTLRKLMDSSKINKLGWRARTPLKSGLTNVYSDFLRRYKV